MTMTAVTWPDRAKVFALGESIIKEFEGFRAKPYPCSAGKPTIGYGSTRYPDGRKVTLADKACSEPEAIVYLEYAMRRVYQDMQACGAVTRPPNLNQAAALLSLAYNIGVGAHDGIKGDLADSTLLQRFNAGDLAGAGVAFLSWNKARKVGILQPVAGLTSRRERERALFLKPT
jgi:lysozyme